MNVRHSPHTVSAMQSQIGQTDSRSSLLRDRLKEKKAEAANAKRRSIDFGGRGGIQSSPVRGLDGESRRPSSSGNGLPVKRATKMMGAKEMEETVSSLHKQNFDLKLELFHRRQRQLDLEERIELAEAQIADQNETQTINEQLLGELLKRDQAIEEAVNIICSLEDKVDRLLEERSIVRSFDSGYVPDRTKSRDEEVDENLSVDYTPAKSAMSNPKISNKEAPAMARMPSFLSEYSENTEALRSLYLPADQPDKPLHSLPKLPEEAEASNIVEPDRMASPSLSVLSESSFLSVYGAKEEAPDSTTDETEDNWKGHELQTSDSLDGMADTRLSHKTPRSSPGKLRNGQYQSINSILDSPLQRLEKLEKTLSKHNLRIKSKLSDPVDHNAKSGRTNNKGLYLQSVDQDLTSQSHLPPTPDTFSTDTIRRGQNIDGQGNGERLTGNQNTDSSTNGLQYRISMQTSHRRPRSVCETLTSTRDGHGWDTETQQSTATSIDARGIERLEDNIGESTNSLVPWHATTNNLNAHEMPDYAEPPQLFTFMGGGGWSSDEEDEDRWGQDMMFDGDKTDRSLAHKSISSEFQNRRAIRRRRSDAEPHRDDTLVKLSRGRSQRNRNPSTRMSSPSDKSIYSSDSRRGNRRMVMSGIQTTGLLMRPELPDRRASLRKGSRSDEKQRTSIVFEALPVRHEAGSLQQIETQRANIDIDVSASKESKSKRITSKIFGLGRSETAPTVSTAQTPLQNTPSEPTSRKSTTTRGSFNRSQSYNDNALAFDGGSTPPPIPRHSQRHDRRPSTANSLDGKLGDMLQGLGARKQAVYQPTGAYVRRNSTDQGNDESPGGARKWFGLGKMGYKK